MYINYTSYLIDWGYEPTIEMALTWKQWGDGNWRARDRGVSQDVYRSSFSVTGTYAQMENLTAELIAYRENILIVTESGEFIFGPHIDYSGYFIGVVEDYGEIQRRSLNVYSIKIKITMSGSPTFIDGAVSTTTFKNDLYSLKSVDLNHSFGTSVTVDAKRHYDGSYEYLDENTDMGHCKMTVNDWTGTASTNKMGSICKAIVTQIRSSAFGWISTGQPNPWGPPKPFGPRTVSTPFAKLVGFSLKSKQGPVGWTLDLDFVEYKFTHDGS